jgi:hypothetical protein
MEAGARRHWSEDDDLADEIELYGELVVAASESERDLTLPQIDKVLGVDQCSQCGAGEPVAPDDGRGLQAAADRSERSGRSA